MSREKRWIAASTAWLLAALLAYLFWPEGKWTVSIEAEPAEATPWQAVHVIARVSPPRSSSRWKWSWASDSQSLPTHAAELTWRSGSVGDHRLEVAVESPRGTRASASVVIPVRYKSYYSPDGMPDLSKLPQDPAPKDLPFGIADVWVEKEHVCQGEPTRIRLTPFDKRGEEKWLIPVVAGQQATPLTGCSAPRPS